jgi:hypothetical protein
MISRTRSEHDSQNAYEQHDTPRKQEHSPCSRTCQGRRKAEYPDHEAQPIHEEPHALGRLSFCENVHARGEEPGRETRRDEQSPPERLTPPRYKHWLFIGERYEPRKEKQYLGGQQHSKHKNEIVEIVMIVHLT